MLRQPTFVGRFLPENDVVTYEAEMEALDRLEENKMETEPSLQDRFERFDGDMRGDDLTARGTTTLKNRRSELAKQRWSDPVYKEKILAKRTQTKAARSASHTNESTAKQDGALVSPVTNSSCNASSPVSKKHSERSRKLRMMRENQNLWMQERLQPSRASPQPRFGSSEAMLAWRLKQNEGRRAGQIRHARAKENKSEFLLVLLERAGLQATLPLLQQVRSACEDDPVSCAGRALLTGQAVDDRMAPSF